jgi:hypothetical protein
MRASGDQLRQIAALVDSGVLRPVVGRVFDFDQTVEAMQSIGKGGIRGKAVITGVCRRGHRLSDPTRTTGRRAIPRQGA